MIYDGSPVNLNVTNMNGTGVSPSVEEEVLSIRKDAGFDTPIQEE